MASPLAVLCALIVTGCLFVSWKHGAAVAGQTYVAAVLLMLAIGWIWWKGQD